MDLWSPPRNVPHLYEWWRPLVQAGARARSEHLPWAVHLDEYRLVGRVSREAGLDVWIYEHVASGGSLCIDAAGEAYRFVATPGAGALGRFESCKLATALRRAGVPRAAVTFRYAEPAPRAAAVGAGSSGEEAAAPREVTRGHLRLV
ncbi:MAG TPA: hypothetical protein VH479_19540 [Acidimicrobiales bacterium]|jgi:hypothetical protein